MAELLPPNVAQDVTVLTAAESLDGELRAVTDAIDECVFLARINKQPGAVLDLLSWCFHVDFYDPTLPIEVKRQLIRNAIPWHRRKSTPEAVEEVITAVFGDGIVTEWWEYGGEPYHFKVETFNTATTNEQAAEFLRALNSVKNARSWLESIELTLGDDFSLYFGGVVHSGDHMEIRQVS